MDDGSGGWAVRHLEYRAPLAWDALLRFFGVRAVPGVEEVDGEVYRRSLVAGPLAGAVEMRALGDRVAVRARPEGLIDAAVDAVRSMLDLGTDPAEVAEGLSGEPVMAGLVAAQPGLRVPGTADPHELAIRAVLGQQISVARARTLAERLVEAYGEPLPKPVGSVTRVFPRAEVLAAADARPQPPGAAAHAERAWAMPGARKRALQGLAALLASGELELDPAGDRERAVAALLAQPGIGPWTAGYIAMRALRDRDAFLPTDVGVRHALDRLGVDSRPRAADDLSQAWRPYRAYALQHLWTVAS